MRCASGVERVQFSTYSVHTPVLPRMHRVVVGQFQFRLKLKELALKILELTLQTHEQTRILFAALLGQLDTHFFL